MSTDSWTGIDLSEASAYKNSEAMENKSSKVNKCCEKCIYHGGEWATTGKAGCCKPTCPCHKEVSKCCGAEPAFKSCADPYKVCSECHKPFVPQVEEEKMYVKCPKCKEIVNCIKDSLCLKCITIKQEHKCNFLTCRSGCIKVNSPQQENIENWEIELQTLYNKSPAFNCTETIKRLTIFIKSLLEKAKEEEREKVIREAIKVTQEAGYKLESALDNLRK